MVEIWIVAWLFPHCEEWVPESGLQGADEAVSGKRWRPRQSKDIAVAGALSIHARMAEGEGEQVDKTRS